MAKRMKLRGGREGILKSAECRVSGAEFTRAAAG